MNLRPRVVLTTLAAGLPALVALWVVGNAIRDRRDDDLFSAMILARFSPAELAACEASPPRAPIGIPLPLQKRGVFRAFGDATELLAFTYDDTGRSSQPGAATLTAPAIEAARAASRGNGQPSDVVIDGRRHLLVPLRGAGGPCAFALTVAPRLGPPGPPPHELLVPIALALLAGLVAIWPVVRRIRSMTVAVRGASEGETLELPPNPGRDELGELSRALSESAATIRRQHADLVARERALLDFIENTTHDLATPLTVLQGNLSAIAARPSADAVRQAMTEAQYIGAVLGNLAVSAKFEAAAWIAVPLDLRDVVARVVDRHRAMARWLGIAMERAVPEERVLAVCDPTFTERALSNLVENAIRHTMSGGHVAVVLEVEGGAFSLRVLDDGPGLTKEECERALQGHEAANAARSRSGSVRRLGLPIVARVAQIQKWPLALFPGETSGLVAELRGPVA